MEEDDYISQNTSQISPTQVVSQTPRVEEREPSPPQRRQDARTRGTTAQRRKNAGGVKPTKRKWPPNRNQNTIRPPRSTLTVRVPRAESPDGAPLLEVQRLRRVRDITAHGILPRDIIHLPGPNMPESDPPASRRDALAVSEEQTRVSHDEAAHTLMSLSRTKDTRTPTEQECRDAEDLGKHVFVAGWNINCPHFITQSNLTMPQFPLGVHEDYQTPPGRPQVQQHPYAFGKPFKSLLTGEPFGPKSFKVLDRSKMPCAPYDCHPYFLEEESTETENVQASKSSRRKRSTPYPRTDKAKPNKQAKTTTKITAPKPQSLRRPDDHSTSAFTEVTKLTGKFQDATINGSIGGSSD